MAKASKTPQTPESSSSKTCQGSPIDYGGVVNYADSEIVIGLVGAMGTDQQYVAEVLIDRLDRAFRYSAEVVRISDLIPNRAAFLRDGMSEYERTSRLMDAGNAACGRAGDRKALALAAMTAINAGREEDDRHELKPRLRRAYIVRTFKRPEEVAAFREVYGSGFFLIGVYSDMTVRRHNLTDKKRMDDDEVASIVARDSDEHLPYGQRTSGTYHLADCFLDLTDNRRFEKDLWRVLDILFGHPYKTPTFNEYAMFMAFAASLRSADLSRQVGAVVARGDEILATGANDCPRFGGGLYWPSRDPASLEISDDQNGRDYMREEDSNARERESMIKEIADLLAKELDGEFSGRDPADIAAILRRSSLADITEYGRVVHAEMEALLGCARNNVSARDGVMYCTTFPCHNCAKHIVAAGIRRVVYIEPYPKSKAMSLHNDSTLMGRAKPGNQTKVEFVPFVGIGPRRFIDLFSMRSGSGYPVRRKENDGKTLKWKQEDNGRLRTQLPPYSYIDLESIASRRYREKGLDNDDAA